MNWNFIECAKLDDYLRAVEGKPEFIHADKGAYSVVNYVFQAVDTFTDPMEEGIDPIERRHRILRRDCRGLIFDRDGNVLAKRFHKFFNANERPETHYSQINLSKPHIVLDKLDGSMVTPIFHRNTNSFRLGTKMGVTDISVQAEQFIASKPQYEKFFRKLQDNNITPIFEWISPENRIVVKYPESNLVLLAARYNNTGQYVPYHQMVDWGASNAIPVVKAYDTISDIMEFIERMRGEKDIEGYVLRFDDGHALKFKCEDYILLHRSKEAAANVRHVVRCVIEEKVDDLKSMVQGDDYQRVVEIENATIGVLTKHASHLTELYEKGRNEYQDRRSFAIEFASKQTPIVKSGLFALWDGKDARQYYCDRILAHCSSETKFADIVKTLGMEIGQCPVMAE